MKVSDRIQRWFTAFLQEASPGLQLPSDRELSAQLGLSVSTVKRFLLRQSRAGTVVRVQGRGTFVAPLEEPVPEGRVVRRRRTADDLAALLTDAVARGDIKRGEPLPSQKFLSLQYEVSPAVVRRACEQLVAGGLVVRVGRRYRVGGELVAVLRKPVARVLFLYSSMASLRELLSGPCGLFVRKMERELFACGYRLRYVPLETLLRADGGVVSTVPDYQGFVITGERLGWVHEGQIESIAERIESLFKRRHRRPAPVLGFVHGRIQRMRRPFSCINRGHLDKIVAREAARFVVSRGVGSAHFFNSDNPHFGLANTLRFFSEVRALQPRFTMTVVVRRRGAVDEDTCKRQVYESLPAHHRETCAQLLGAMTVVDDFVSVYRQCRSAGWWLFQNESDAAEACTWCAEHGIEVPRKRNIFCFESTAQYQHRGISGCIYDWDQVGYCLAHTLIDDIPIKKSSHGYIVPRAMVLERMTTDPGTG